MVSILDENLLRMLKPTRGSIEHILVRSESELARLGVVPLEKAVLCSRICGKSNTPRRHKTTVLQMQNRRAHVRRCSHAGKATFEMLITYGLGQVRVRAKRP